jgi:hypothetical protein
MKDSHSFPIFEKYRRNEAIPEDGGYINQSPLLESYLVLK